MNCNFACELICKKTHIKQLPELNGPEEDLEDVLTAGSAQLAAGVQRYATELHETR